MTKFVLDAHFDVLLDVLHYRQKGERKVLERLHLPALKKAGVNAVICSLFIMDDILPEGALRNALDQISALQEELSESGEYIALCRTVKEADAAAASGKIALFLSLEGAEPIGSDLFLLRTFYDLGVRFLGITWSRRNYAADGCAFSSENAPRIEGGLTKFGRELVEKACELGMVIDVSHLNDPGFFEVAEMVKKPFIASHSNCRSLCSSPRNLTDAQIMKLAQSGGVMGMNSYSAFSADIRPHRTAEKLLEHIDHIIELAGADHVGLGMDLFDVLASLRIADPQTQHGDLFKDHAEAEEKFLRLIKERYPKRTADKILGGNFIRVIKEVIG